MNSEAIKTIRRLDASVFHTDNESLTVDINIVACFDDGEHSVSITWDPHTDEVSLERI
jgi:hypothetical protein